MDEMRLLTILLSIACISSATAETFDVEHISVSSDIELTRVNRNFYVHTSWFDFPGFGRFPSNGLILVKNGKALMIDTPNSIEQTIILHEFVSSRLAAKLQVIIVGHSHSDCMGGLSALHDRGVESIACVETVQICKAKQLPIPKVSFVDALTFEFEGEKVICRYFGAGHTSDNIVVYFPNSRILFGGCLVKSLNAKGLGSIRDAVIDDWDATVGKIKRAYPETRLVIPGHGSIGDMQLLDHTINLVRAFKQNNP